VRLPRRILRTHTLHPSQNNRNRLECLVFPVELVEVLFTREVLLPAVVVVVLVVLVAVVVVVLVLVVVPLAVLLPKVVLVVSLVDDEFPLFEIPTVTFEESDVPLES
jgi:hypothetical protein